MAKALSPGATARRQRDNGRPSYTLASETVSAIGGQLGPAAAGLLPPRAGLTRITAAITRRFIVHLSAKLKRSFRDNKSGGTATPLMAEAEAAAAVEEEAAEEAAEEEAEAEAEAAEAAAAEVEVVAARVAPSAASWWRPSGWNC